MGRPGPETKLMNAVKEKMEERYGSDLLITKYHGDMYAKAGVSDWLVCFRGVFIAAEWKAPDNYGGSVERAEEKGGTVKQKEFVRKVIAAGGVGGVVASEESFQKLLDEAAKVAQKRKKRKK